MQNTAPPPRRLAWTAPYRTAQSGRLPQPGPRTESCTRRTWGSAGAHPGSGMHRARTHAAAHSTGMHTQAALARFTARKCTHGQKARAKKTVRPPAAAAQRTDHGLRRVPSVSGCQPPIPPHPPVCPTPPLPLPSLHVQVKPPHLNKQQDHACERQQRRHLERVEAKALLQPEGHLRGRGQRCTTTARHAGERIHSPWPWRPHTITHAPPRAHPRHQPTPTLPRSHTNQLHALARK